MQRPACPARPVLAGLLSALALVVASTADATCGGGGGGGTGGISGGTGSAPQVFPVPWTVHGSAPLPSEGLVLFWFPISVDEARGSSLRESRRLSLWAGQCVAPVLVPDGETELHQRHTVPTGSPLALLARPDGTALTRIEARDGRLEVSAVEREVDRALDAEEDRLDGILAAAKAKEKGGERDAAIGLYREVAAARCLFARLGKKAQKALDALGATSVGAIDLGDEQPLPDLADSTTTTIREALLAGLEAERRLDLATALARYQAARDADPADPIPLRYLGELHRHHSGDWALARRLFEQLLALPHADPFSRAVALHGLGKMTIHGGDFDGGLALFARSLAAHPLPLTYRNLAVYWSSEGEIERAWRYVERALELAPDDVYTRVFAATFYVELGRPDEAEAIAAAHADLLEASYNLAAIWAQLGKRERMLELLARHFYAYERTDAVRAKEMQEARDDRVFASFHQDRAFRALTALAEVDATSYHQMPGASGP